jgi:alkanesulfonate monooxygenase SsuD/methylene tetrahydromethanopterin reductase-like flavin-dependent oxidoreductase (luciferase family)
VTGIVILPQRQAVLVAKQAAEVDLLSGGRLRLGVGLGWNAVEYEALGEDFSTRGGRCEEQVELMRKLWTEQTVTFRGNFHRVTGAGLAPLPRQRPIPVWFGASSPRARRPPRRWMVSDGGARSETRAGTGGGAASRDRSRPGPRRDRHGGPGFLER